MRNYTPLAAILLAFGCGSPTPTAPPETPLPPAAAVKLDGTWTGVYKETTCSATCIACCSYRWKGSGPGLQPFTLIVTQRGSTITAQFAEAPRPGKDGSLTGPVEGTVSALQVGLNGSLSWQSQIYPDVFGSALLFAHSLTADAAGQHITGGFTLVDRRSTGEEWMRRDCEIVRLERTGP